jgi:thiamine biosynthesis lipoprotein
VTRPGRSTEIRKKNGHFEARFVAMGSPCEVLLESNSESNAAAVAGSVSTEAWRIEDKFSRYLPDNIVHRINNSGGAPVEVDDETANLIDFAATLYEMSDGRFDITSGVLREAWNFDGSDNVPADSEVDRILERVGWSRVKWNRPELILAAGMQIDLGGIAKEYAVDKAASAAAAETDDACLVNFGGDLVATKAPTRSKGWQVGIDALDQAQGLPQKLIRLQNGGLATSGDARRFLLKDGIRYGHILDPTTGWPVQYAPRSITVAADTCTQAGMLATLAMLEGKGAETFLADQDCKYWCYR